MVLEGDLCLTRGRRGRESGVTRWCQSGGMDQNNAAFWHRSPTQRRWGLAAAGAQGRRRHREETNSQHPSGKLLILRPRKKKGTRIREGKPLWGTARLPFLTGLPFYSGCGCFFFTQDHQIRILVRRFSADFFVKEGPESKVGTLGPSPVNKLTMIGDVFLFRHSLISAGVDPVIGTFPCVLLLGGRFEPEP